MDPTNLIINNLDNIEKGATAFIAIYMVFFLNKNLAGFKLEMTEKIEKMTSQLALLTKASDDVADELDDLEDDLNRGGKGEE